MDACNDGSMMRNPSRGAGGPPSRQPLGIERAAALLYIVAGLLAWGGLWALLWFEEGVDFLRTFASGAALLAAAALLVAIARGVSRGRHWAWRATFLATGLTALAGLWMTLLGFSLLLASLASDELGPGPMVIAEIAIGPLVLLASIWTARSFSKPEAKAWFGQGDAPGKRT